MTKKYAVALTSSCVKAGSSQKKQTGKILYVKIADRR